MSNDLRYPLIMQPGQLRKLNDYVISTLGVPLFFATPEPSRPHSEDPCGRLYEIVTGLYIIYHDYGIRFLQWYLIFMKDYRLITSANSLYAHYESISRIRGGFCHGSLPRGSHGASMMQRLNFHFPGAKDQAWPGMLPTMTEQQCAKMVNDLTDHSDRLYAAIKECADIIAAHPGLLTSLKQTIFDRVINKDYPKYGSYFFDQRILSDIEPVCRGDNNEKPYQGQLQRWLADVENVIRNGTMPNSDYLQDSLMSALRNLYQPQISIERKCSADIFDDL